MSPLERRQRIEAHRQRFRRAGLPLFDEDFSASTNVFNRAAPLLALVFVAEMLGAISLEWSLLANLGAALAGLGILLLAAGLLNRSRGRPLRSIPEQVEAPELIAFVLLPALLPLIFDTQVRSAVGTAAANLALLAVIYATFAYGLPSLVRWTFERLTKQLLSSVMLLARAVPLLLIFALLAFVNTEMWQLFATVSDPGLIAIGALFLIMGTAFLLARLPREISALEAGVNVDAPPLGTRQRRNVGAVLFVSQAVQVLTVALLVAVFFTLFGTIAIGAEVRESWIGSGGDVLLDLDLFGASFQVTSELLKVSGGLAAFTGLYFAIAMLTDATYREEFLDEVTTELRSVFRERADYLRLRGSEPAG